MRQDLQHLIAYLQALEAYEADPTLDHLDAIVDTRGDLDIREWNAAYFESVFEQMGGETP
jgi:hypothetical protein